MLPIPLGSENLGLYLLTRTGKPRGLPELGAGGLVPGGLKDLGQGTCKLLERSVAS